MTYLIKDNNQSFLLRIHKTVDGLDLSAGSRNIHRSILIDSEIKLLNQLQKGIINWRRRKPSFFIKKLVLFLYIQANQLTKLYIN